LPSADQVWIVSDGVFPAALLAGPDTTGAKSMAGNLVGYLRSIAFGLHADKGLELSGTIECTSEEGGRRVRDTLKGMVGVGRLSTRDDQLALLKVYDSVKVDQVKDVVKVSAAVAGDMVDPLLNSVTRRK
jgi:hypothetical protein